MYDIGVALRRFKPLIMWTAWRTAANRSLKMQFDDIEAEGLLVLVECCRSFPEGQTRFARYFKKAWYNRLKHLYRNAHALKRQGIEVELEDALSIPHQPVKSDFMERARTRYQEIHQLLSVDARRLLQTLLDPPQTVYDEAWRDFCRKNKLRSLGQRVTGDKKFRIRLRHISKSLGFSSVRMREVVSEVKSVNRKYLRGKRNEETKRKEKGTQGKEGQVVPRGRGRRGRGARRRTGG